MAFPKCKIEAILSVHTFKETDPKRTRSVLLTESEVPGILFQECFNFVFYVNKSSEEDMNGWYMAGWLKESLSGVLSEQPMLSGRIRRREGGGSGALEIVSNDSGIRLLEARMPTTLLDFLGIKESEEEAEQQLVFWNDIDIEHPEFSPLCYVQVTNFECGGYAIGMSCSILLADVILMTSFLERWTNMHNLMLSEIEGVKMPIYYSPKLNPSSMAASFMVPSPTKRSCKTYMFSVSSENMIIDDTFYKTQALLGIEEVKKRLDCKMPAEFSLLVNESSSVIKVEDHLKEVDSGMPVNHKLIDATWHDFGFDEITLCTRNKPAHFSCWIRTGSKGIVMAMPSEKRVHELKIIVAVPSE